MRWTKTTYPEQMSKLEKNARNKAIEIANTLVDNGGDENSSISAAINKAKAWAEKRKSKNISLDGMYFREGFNFPYQI